MLLVVSDAEGNVVRTLYGPTGEGMHRVTWDLRDPAATLATTGTARAEDDDDDSPRRRSAGPLVAPGKYTVRLFKRVEGKVTPLGGQRRVQRRARHARQPGRRAVVAEQVAFHRQVLKLSRAVTGATNVAPNSARGSTPSAARSISRRRPTRTPRRRSAR